MYIKYIPYPFLVQNGSTQYSVGWYSHSVTTPLGGERFGGRGWGVIITFAGVSTYKMKQSD